jgi:5-methylcytosine-specific restriction endonuclease McrA
MTKVLDKKVLVLNKSWIPVHVTTAKRAICLVYSELARVVHVSTYETYEFESWCEQQSEDYIGTPHIKIPVPSVIMLTAYNGLRTRVRIPFSRSSLLKRDESRCQYCGEKLAHSLLTIDHVLPRSKGGTTTWTNCVAACVTCNNKKDNRTPMEAHMILLKEPIVPKWSFKMFDVCHEKWETFFSGHK